MDEDASDVVEWSGHKDGRLPIKEVRDNSQGDGDRPFSFSHQQYTDNSPPWSPPCRHAVTDLAFN